MSRVLLFLSSLFLIIFLASCSNAHSKNTIKVGVIAGPESELMETAKKVAEQKYNLNIQVVEFSDYTMPNEALADGSIDANAFQHLPYLQTAIQAKGYRLTPIAKTFIYPMAFYSKKIHHLNELKDGATIAIQNDPSNEGRALLLLQKAGLIKLRPAAGFTATPLDIISNPKNLKFQVVDAAQIPRVLPDVAMASINTNYAALANLSPTKDGLIVEDANSPYTNLIVVRIADKNNPLFAQFIQAYQSPEVEKKAQDLFKGGAVPAWKLA